MLPAVLVVAAGPGKMADVTETEDPMETKMMTSLTTMMRSNTVTNLASERKRKRRKRKAAKTTRSTASETLARTKRR